MQSYIAGCAVFPVREWCGNLLTHGRRRVFRNQSGRAWPRLGAELPRQCFERGGGVGCWGGGECLASPWAAENCSAADPSGACRERGGPRGWEGAGSRLLLQQGAAGWGAQVQLPLSRVSEQSPPRSGVLRASALLKTPVGLLTGTFRKVSGDGRRSLGLLKSLEAAELLQTPGRGRALCGRGARGRGERKTVRINWHRGRSPGGGGVLGLSQGRSRDWAVAEAVGAPDRRVRRCHRAPSPLQRLPLYSSPAAASTMFFTCGPNEAMVVSGKSPPSQ